MSKERRTVRVIKELKDIRVALKEKGEGLIVKHADGTRQEFTVLKREKCPVCGQNTLLVEEMTPEQALALFKRLRPDIRDELINNLAARMKEDG